MKKCKHKHCHWEVDDEGCARIVCSDCGVIGLPHDEKYHKRAGSPPYEEMREKSGSRRSANS